MDFILLIKENIYFLIVLIASALLIPDIFQWGDTVAGFPIRMVILFVIFIICGILDRIKESKMD